MTWSKLTLLSTSNVTNSCKVLSLALIDCMYSILSTPFICCSIGVATDCSIVTASAPGYVVETMICGGTMSGNCATGSPPIATRPAMTVTIAMTIATIGRPMKNRDTGYFLEAVGVAGAVGSGAGFGLTTIPGLTF